MNVYLLRAQKGHEDECGSYDECNGFVIRAESEQRARDMAAGAAWDEGKDFWIDPARSYCLPLPVDGAEEIVMSDTHPG